MYFILTFHSYCVVMRFYRTVVSRQYIDDMHRAKVIVTVNPSGWEGGKSTVYFIRLHLYVYFQ